MNAMRRGLLFFASILLSLTAAADNRANGLLTQMSAKLKAMGEYEVAFHISAEGFKANGGYMVSGREYCLTLGDAEVFCDGSTRYEVNKALEEITIDNIDFTEHNILNNPVGGLDFLGDEFSSAVVSQDADSTVIRLTPVNGARSSVIEVTMNNSTRLPVRLVYRMGNDTIAVDLTSIRPASTALRRFDAKAYPGYEVIDFR